MNKLLEDLSFGFNAEDEVLQMIETYGRKIIKTPDTDILDFKIIDKNLNEVWLELKTRRCNKDTYPDSMIGLNKLIEAFKRYNESGLYTLFAFKFLDGVYIVNPFLTLPRFDYRRGRWDRGPIDKEKAWIYYRSEDLKKIEDININ